jgi:hypothetical protein
LFWIASRSAGGYNVEYQPEQQKRKLRIILQWKLRLQELTVKINPRDPSESIFGLAPAKPEPATDHKPAELPARGQSLKPPRVQPIKDEGEPAFSPKLPPPQTVTQTLAGTKWSWVLRGILLVTVIGVLVFYFMYK